MGIKRPLDDDYEEDEDDHKRRRGDGPKVELRFLLASKNAGAIIGKGGSNIKRLRQDYKASVTVPDSTSPERVLTIGANLGTALECVLDIILNWKITKTTKTMTLTVRCAYWYIKVKQVVSLGEQDSKSRNSARGREHKSKSIPSVVLNPQNVWSP